MGVLTSRRRAGGKSQPARGAWKARLRAIGRQPRRGRCQASRASMRAHCCCAADGGTWDGAGSSPVLDDAVGQNADYAALTKVGRLWFKYKRAAVDSRRRGNPHRRQQHATFTSGATRRREASWARPFYDNAQCPAAFTGFGRRPTALHNAHATRPCLRLSAPLTNAPASRQASIAESGSAQIRCILCIRRSDRASISTGHYTHLDRSGYEKQCTTNSNVTLPLPKPSNCRGDFTKWLRTRGVV